MFNSLREPKRPDMNRNCPERELWSGFEIIADAREFSMIADNAKRAFSRQGALVCQNKRNFLEKSKGKNRPFVFENVSVRNFHFSITKYV